MKTLHKSWGSKHVFDPGKKTEDTNGAGLQIVRLAPGDGLVTVDWMMLVASENVLPLRYELTVGLKGGDEISAHPVADGEMSFTVSGLVNGENYAVRVIAYAAGSNTVVSESLERLVRPGIVPGTVVNYIHPDDDAYQFSGHYAASPSIAQLPDGGLVASHDIFGDRGSGQSLSKIFRSDDGGKTWRFLTDVFPCFWGKLFVLRGSLYMLAASTEYGSLLIGRSDDGGETWSEPTVLITPDDWQIPGGIHKAPVPVVVHQGRVWSAVEFGTWDNLRFDAGVVSAPVEADLLDKEQWTVTPFLPYDRHWQGTVANCKTAVLIEGNVVVTPAGGLVNVLRYNTIEGDSAIGRAVVLDVNLEQPDSALAFREVIDFPGSQTKFAIHYDGQTGHYLSLGNRVTTNNGAQRNILALTKSSNLLDWSFVIDVLNYEENGWYEDRSKTAFQYVDWLIDGEDILFLSRTAINGAKNFHDANHLTFHRIEQFRKLLS
ncbi:exo-alpha-sialidase [Paenibacillus whitsoniae]|uniref:Exo-alpha-sialidase n=1 Tax=Paenibacillus whitsoniae TaxID=2496558 RepID=A0A3S0AE58_9BACL|nr:exo-alpha-sialidase [Paenibacillus whitsoniae]RTE10851.1 exo-alpha-sialidase [Paenibacillus whitsoniae]